ncbi:MAG TPA: HAD-IA family hydrolase [Bacteroidales bacterium]|nr:HAD-IA family hydrolase [Bacteroidales bacterium]
MRISGILFDVDGTLINTWDLYLEAYRLIVQPYVRKTLTTQDIESTKPTPELHFIERTIPEKEQDQAFRRFISHYGYLYDSTSRGMYPGVSQMLSTLRELKYPLGIFTGKSRPAWEITCRKESLGDFDVVVTDNDVEHHKPNPEGLEKAADQLSTDRSTILYIGDNLMDCHAASQAGTQFAGALWAKSEQEKQTFREEAKKIGLKSFLEQPNDLFKILKR